jgi:hypothetical protein
MCAYTTIVFLSLKPVTAQRTSPLAEVPLMRRISASILNFAKGPPFHRSDLATSGPAPDVLTVEFDAFSKS